MPLAFVNIEGQLAIFEKIQVITKELCACRIQEDLRQNEYLAHIRYGPAKYF